MSIKLGSFADISPLLDRQIEELVAVAQQTQEELGLVVATPSAITTLTTEGGWGNILLNYSYTNYNGHLYTEIWRSADSTFANGYAVGATAAKFYTDSPENAQLTDVYYYWVRNVNLEGTTSDWYGPTSGSISAVSSFNVDDLIGQLGFEHFASGTMPIRSEATLPDLSTTPANYPVGSIIHLTTNHLLYKNVAWVWKELIAAEDMVGEITETQIADGSISTPKLQAQSVTSNELMANSIIAGKIAAGALAVDDGVMQNGYIKNALVADAAITNAKIAGTISSSDGVTWSIDKEGGIDCRDLTIRNTDGTVLLQSGGSLDFADIVNGPPSNADATDYTTINNDIAAAQAAAQAHADAQDVLYENLQGAFAYLDQINTGNISTYIAGAAIGTAYIADAAITNALIANLAVDGAKIANAAITNAKIGSLAVDTAKIADGAITSAKIGTAEVSKLNISGTAYLNGKQLSAAGTGSVSLTTGNSSANSATITHNLGRYAVVNVWGGENYGGATVKSNTSTAFQIYFPGIAGDPSVTETISYAYI